MPDLTLREQILRALVALWDAPSKPGRLSVHRSPGRALQPPDDYPEDEAWLAFAVLPDPDETETVQRLDHYPGDVEHTMGVLAALRASGKDVETLYELADQAYAWMVTQVAASRAAGLAATPKVGPLGGLCEDIRETGTPRYEVQDFDETYIRLDVRWEITYWTSEADPREPPEVPE